MSKQDDYNQQKALDKINAQNAQKASANQAKINADPRARQRQADARAQADARVSTGGRPGQPSYTSALGSRGYIDPQYRMDQNIKELGKLAPVSSIVDEYDKRLNGTLNPDGSYTGGVNPDKRGLEAFRGEALRTGPSAWMNQEMLRNKAEESQGLQDLASSGAGNAANAMAGLAARRGLSSGAAERVGMNAANDTALQQQRARSSAMLGRMGLSSQDEQNRLAMLGKLPGQEMDYANFNLDKQKLALGQLSSEQVMNRNADIRNRDEYINAKQNDISNSIAALGGKSTFDSNKYTADMGAWGAEQQAQAIKDGAPPKIGTLQKAVDPLNAFSDRKVL